MFFPRDLLVISFFMDLYSFNTFNIFTFDHRLDRRNTIRKTCIMIKKDVILLTCSVSTKVITKFSTLGDISEQSFANDKGKDLIRTR